MQLSCKLLVLTVVFAVVSAKIDPRNLKCLGAYLLMVFHVFLIIF